MLTAVLSCALLLALPATQGAQMSLASPEGIRRPDQALFPELSGLGLRPRLKRTTAEQAEKALLQEAKDLAEVLDPEGCKPHSPCRCMRLHESYLGQQLPRSDPCAMCHCRFFNAFCYCCKLGTAASPCSHT